jgi:serine/threonine-protein kinase
MHMHRFVVTYFVIKAIHREADILAAMHHPSIVTLIGFSMSPRCEIILVTELCDTDLMQLLERWTQNRGCNDPAAAVHLGKHVASAMSFLHSKGIIHGDIKVRALYIVLVCFATPNSRINTCTFC